MHHYIAECIGTSVLLILGCGTASSSSSNLAVAASFGFGLLIAAGTFGPFSRYDGHFNPSITIASWLCKKEKVKGVFPLLFTIVAQMVGGILGTAVVMSVYGNGVQSAITLPNENYTWWNVFFAELWGTILLILFVLFFKGGYGPLAAGCCLTGLILAFGEVSGGGFNFARCFGTAVITTKFEGLYIYLAAQLLASFVAFLGHFFMTKIPGVSSSWKKGTDIGMESQDYTKVGDRL